MLPLSFVQGLANNLHRAEQLVSSLAWLAVVFF
jgi:hypothetical protein